MVKSLNKQLAFSLSFLLSPAAALAQDLVEIEVVGRDVNLVGRAASASEGRVSHRELDQRAMLRSGEVLETVPGMVATQHSGSGKANQYYLRGFNLDHGTDFATSIDGMPINMRSHGHGQGYTDLNFLIPEMIEEIIYRKGSYHAEVGDFSGAGSAEIRSLAHADQQTLSIGAGEYGFARALLHGGVDSLDGELFYGLERQTHDGPWDAIDEDIDKTNLWLKQQWQTETETRSLSFMAYDNSWNAADQIPARAVESGLISKFGSIDPTVGGESSRYSLSGNYLRELADGEFQANAYAIDYDMTLWSNFSYFTSPGGDQFQQIDERRIYGGGAQWRRESSLAGYPLATTLGGELRIDAVDEVGLLSTSQRRYVSDIRVDAVDQWSGGLYWQGELHWSERLRSELGLRYDYYDFEVEALAAAIPASLAANSGSADDDIVTTSLALMYRLSDDYELYAAIGEGFHSNDARGTTIRLDPLTGEPVQPVDSLVDTLASEVGFRAFIGERLNATLALWQLDIDSELLFVGDAGNTEDTGVGSERHGVELTSYLQLNDFWALDLEYAWTEARFEEAVDGSRDIPAALDQVLSAGINFSPVESINANLRLRHFGDYPLDGGATAAASTMVNLRLSWQASPSLRLAIDALNLLDSDDHDVEYFYESQLPGEATPIGDRHYHVFEPRSLRAYLDYRF